MFTQHVYYFWYTALLKLGGGEIYSNSKGNIGSVDENGTVYSHSKGFIGHVDPGDIMGALYLLKDEF